MHDRAAGRVLVPFQSGSDWTCDVGFYLFGLIYGILLISQFWTLANTSSIRGRRSGSSASSAAGSSLGGALAGSSLALQAKTIGTTNLMLVSAGDAGWCAWWLVTIIIKRERTLIRGSLTGGEDEGVSGATRSACSATAGTCRRSR